MRYLVPCLVVFAAWQSAPHTSVNPADAPISVSLNERNKGGTILLAEDGVARLKLFLDPNGGSAWLLDDVSTRSVQLASKPTTAGLKTKRPYQTFSFKGLAPGLTALSFRQVKTNRGPAPGDPTFTLSIRVVP